MIVMDNYNSFDYSGVSQAKAAIHNTIENTPFNPISTAETTLPFLSGLAPALASGAISGLIGLGQSELNYQNQKKLNKQMYKINKQLAEQAFERNVQMWNKQNEYNSPAEQVARLRAAGVNPAIAFGSGNMTGNAEAAPELAYSEYNPKVPLFDFGNPIASAISGYQATLQARDIQSKIEERESNVMRNYSSAAKTDKDTEFLSRTMQDRVLNWSLQNSQLSKNIEVATANLANVNFDSELKVKTLIYFDRIKELQVEAAYLDNEFKRGEIKKIDHIIKNLDSSSQKMLQEAISTAKSLGPTIANLNAYTHLLGSKADWTDQDKERISQEMTAFDTKMRKLNAEISGIIANTSKTWMERGYLKHKQDYTDALTDKTKWESSILEKDLKYHCLVNGGVLGQSALALGGTYMGIFGQY